jgi:Family of unknown function (DUF6152)
MIKTCLIVFFSAIALLTAVPVVAHHSFAMFDRDKQVTLVGTVLNFQWTNPHSWIEIDVPNENGGSDKWSIECNSPNNLARQGWKSTSLKPGDKATIIIHPLRSGEKGGSFVSVTLPDGSVLAEPAYRGPSKY